MDVPISDFSDLSIYLSMKRIRDRDMWCVQNKFQKVRDRNGDFFWEFEKQKRQKQSYLGEKNAKTFWSEWHVNRERGGLVRHSDRKGAQITQNWERSSKEKQGTNLGVENSLRAKFVEFFNR